MYVCMYVCITFLYYLIYNRVNILISKSQAFSEKNSRPPVWRTGQVAKYFVFLFSFLCPSCLLYSL